MRASAELLHDTALYLFVSSVSVYADFSTGPHEESACADLGEASADELAEDFSNYGALKALCERAVCDVFRERSLIVRPGLIVGPHDPTGRFTYWAHRLERGGEILAPGPPEHPAQFIDVRDLAEWLVLCVERRVTGVFNATNEGVPWSDLLAGADVTWVSSEHLAEHGVGEWMELPLWIGDPAWAGMHRDGHQPRRQRRAPLPSGRGDACGCGRGSRRRRRRPDARARGRAARGLARAMKVAYPGREGAHSAAACALLFPDDDAQALPSFSDVVAAVASGRVDAGVLPIESSISGPVAETHDLLVDSATSINEQAILPIRHFLVGVAEVALPEIRIVRSHPVALDQCRRLLAALPEAQAIAAGTTADAAAQVARDAEPTEVAIASERAAALHGLVVLAADVGDHPEAFTRFVAISNRTQLEAGGDWRIAFSFQTDHRPGALHRAIEPFARHALDLVQLTSRPIPQTPWRYRFDAVVSGHPFDPVVGETLAEVRRQAQRFTVFGSYPA